MVALLLLFMAVVTAAGRDVGFGGTTCGFVATTSSRFHRQQRQQSGRVRVSSRSASASAARMTVSEGVSEGADGMFLLRVGTSLSCFCLVSRRAWQFAICLMS